MGVAITVIVLAMMAVDRLPLLQRLAAPMIAVGTMSLTAYVGHFVLIPQMSGASGASGIGVSAGAEAQSSWMPVLMFIFGAMVFAWIWSRFFRKGPLEYLLNIATKPAKYIRSDPAGGRLHVPLRHVRRPAGQNPAGRRARPASSRIAGPRGSTSVVLGVWLHGAPTFLGQLVQTRRDLSLRLAEINEAREHERELITQTVLARVVSATRRRSWSRAFSISFMRTMSWPRNTGAAAVIVA
ncbi:DUF418 domain-containing protein [Kibdelosporangium aridum]|uniref:DUF418 domain-containing protein n=1 Tax=Kibdelosporangium aridum TaxID=2030 RepID=UPI001C8B8A3E|nr:DUF418 domain-containing protein [Kibdelosporangium aridum]